MKSLLLLLGALCVLGGSTLSLRAEQVEIVNNQPFPIRMPWRLHDGTNVMIDVAASGKQSTDTTPPQRGAPLVSVEPVASGIHLETLNQDLGTLQWDVIVENV